MQQLKLVGPQDGHTNLVLETSDGTRYLLATDPELLSAIEATRVPKPSPKPSVGSSNYPEELTPREIQSRIREGSSVEDLVYSCGMDEKYVQRYAQPVLDERRYIVQLAQQVQVAETRPEQERFPVLHPEPATLLDMVTHQLKTLKVPVDSLEWDAWRDLQNTWHVQATFDKPQHSYLFQDQEPEARWYFNPSAKQLENANQWAQSLSEEGPLDDPIAGQHLSAVPVEDSLDSHGETQEDQDALLELLRERRGTRLGSNEESDDELANFIARGFDPQDETLDETLTEPQQDQFGMPAPQDSGLDAPRGLVRHIDFGVHKDIRDESAESEEGTDDVPAPIPAAKKHGEIRGQTDALQEVADKETQESKKASNDSATTEVPQKETGASENQSESAENKALKQVIKKKPRRSSVPSWDEIVFGTKGE